MYKRQDYFNVKIILKHGGRSLAKLGDEIYADGHIGGVEAVSYTHLSHIFEEYGDLLFSAVNVSRFLKIDSEQALNGAANKFVSRFEKVENLANQKGIDMKSSTLETLDKLWDEAKTCE